MAKNLRKKQQPRNRRAFAREPLELLPATQTKSFDERWLPILIVAALAIIAYIPSFDNGFVSWDDDHYIFKNPAVSFDDGIKSIWGDVITYSEKRFRSKAHESRVSHQYYPMVFTTYWLEFRFHKWINGADPDKTIEKNIADGKMTASSFHVVSAVMHAINVMLLIFCLRALGLSNWVAWAATILFALHPMQVATVAWAAERKNIISLMFYLMSMMAYLKLRREGGWWRYVLALVLFQAALFSKTVSLSLPIMLFFTDRLLERKWEPRLIARSVLRLLPFVLLSCIAAYTTMRVEDRGRTIPLNSDQRPFVIFASALFYPFKMLFPVDQSPVYRLWSPSAAELKWFLPVIIFFLIAGLVVVYRRRLGPHFIWAVLFYLVTQGPMLGFKNINYYQFSFVADHYFYHGSVGLFVALALGFEALRRRIKPPKRGFVLVTGLVSLLALGCGVKTWFYCDTWQNPEEFWRVTLEENPDCWPAWYNTANARIKDAAKTKDPVERDALLEDAAARYQRVAEINRGITHPFDRLLEVRKMQKKWAAGFEVAKAAVQRFGHLPKYYAEAGMMARRAGMFEESATYHELAGNIYLRKKKTDWAISNYVRAAAAAGRANQTDKAVELFRRAGKLAGQMGNRSMRGGKACRASKEYKRSARYFATAAKLTGDSVGADLNALAAASQKKKQQADKRCKAGG